MRDGSLIILLARPPGASSTIRSGWGGGRVRATAIELEPLGPEESGQLVSALAGGGELSAGTRQALLDKTGGNPLFLEETMRMVEERRGTGPSASRTPSRR